MPRKRCTFYDGKSCRSKYDQTKGKEAEKVTVYGFPSNPEEQERWNKNLSIEVHAKEIDTIECWDSLVK